MKLTNIRVLIKRNRVYVILTPYRSVILFFVKCWGIAVVLLSIDRVDLFTKLTLSSHPHLRRVVTSSPTFLRSSDTFFVLTWMFLVPCNIFFLYIGCCGYFHGFYHILLNFTLFSSEVTIHYFILQSSTQMPSFNAPFRKMENFSPPLHAIGPLACTR